MYCYTHLAFVLQKHEDLTDTFGINDGYILFSDATKGLTKDAREY